MAQPSPIFVTTSTTLVQVNPLLSPYTPVLLNSYNYTGQVVSVLDATSSFGALTTPIVISTATSSQFADGSVSTLINQPQGFVTLQAQAPNTWSFLNSFPFRNQYTSAGLLTLNTSTLNVAVLSTLQEYTSSLRVENLVVSGNFSQSSPLTLNTTLSSFGSVQLFSTFTAWGATFFSSGLSTSSAVQLQSSLTVLGNLTTTSSIQVLSTMFVSESVLTTGIFSTPLVSISGNLDTYKLVVQQSTSQSVNAAGSVYANQLTTLSSLRTGGDLLAYNVTTGNFSTLSSMSIYSSLEVTKSTFIQVNLSSLDALLVLGNLSSGWNTRVNKDILVSSNVFVGGFLALSTHVSTLDLQANSLWVKGNLEVNPQLSDPSSAERITIGKSFGVGSVLTTSTTIGGKLSTPASLAIWGSLYGESSFQTRWEVSTLNSFSTLGSLYVLGSLSSFQDVSISGPLTVFNSMNVASTSYWNQSNTSSSYIQGDLSILGNLTLTDTLTLSSIVLPSSVLANNFQLSSLFVGFKGYTSTSFISTLFASSIATGGLTNSAFTVDMANVLQTYTLSTLLMSTLQLDIFSEGTFTPSTFFHTTSSFGVQTQASTNQLESKTLAYSLCNLYIAKTLSTNTLYGNNILGPLFGDARQLSNVQFPASLSTGLTTTSTMIAGVVTASSFFTSTLNAAAFFNYSTLKVNDFFMFGNAATTPATSFLSNYIAAPYSPSNLLVLNPISCYGDQTGLAFKQVLVNSSLLPSFPTDTYALGVGGTLRLNNISSPLFQFPLTEYRGDIVVTQLLGSISVQSLYVSSGLIGLSSGSFFLPEGTSLLARSTNTIQPSLSTLSFNSTLFVKQDSQGVGVLTLPTYTLDVKGTAYASKNVLTNSSTIVRDQIVSRQPIETYWYGVGEYSTGLSSNIRYSEDGETWVGDTTQTENFALPLCNISYNGGAMTIDSGNIAQGTRTWVATGGIGVLYKQDTGIWKEADVQQTVKKNALTNSAFNGSYWIMTSYNPTNPTYSALATVMRSEDGVIWNNSVSGGFGWNGLSDYHGGWGVAWGGSLWVAVGIGSDPLNSIIYSSDGNNWSNIASGGFSLGGYGVVYTGCNWVAVGNSGNGVSFATSSNGLAWSTINYGFIGSGRGIAWNGMRLVAVGAYDTGFPSILYSDTYGQSWESASGTLFDTVGASGQCVVWNGSYWLAGGTTGIRKSYDGVTWFQPVASPTYSFTGLGWSSNALPSLAVGFSTLLNFSSILTTTFSIAVGEDTSFDSNRTIFYSSNGTNWNRAVSGYFGGSGRGIAYNGSNLWVAVGDGAVVTSNVLYSGNGSNWSNFTLLSVANVGTGNAVLYTAVKVGGSYWVSLHTPAAPADPTQFYSTDGQIWYESGGQQFSVAAYGASVNPDPLTGGTIIAVGEDSSYNVKYSDDGENWNNATFVTNFFDQSGRAVLYSASIWVAAGIDSGGKTLKWTSDAFGAWTDGTGSLFTVAGYGVAYDGVGKWVAVGDSGGAGGTIKYSTDGKAWSAAASGEFTDKGRGIIYNQGSGLWLATGTLVGTSAMKYSGDGINWSDAVGGDFQTTGYGVATTSNILTTIQPYYEQVRFLKNPGPQVTRREVTPYIAYTSTLLDMNNVLSFDAQANIVIATSTISQYTSSFYVAGPTIVSGFVSSPSIALNGGFYLSMQNV